MTTDTETADDGTDGRTCATCGEPLPTIVELVTHDCETLLSADDLTRGERNTLMYVEARVVDHAGVLDWEQMNYEASKISRYSTPPACWRRRTPRHPAPGTHVRTPWR